MNNYSYDNSSYTSTENNHLPPSNSGNVEKGVQIPTTQHQTITVDYGNIADVIKVQEKDDGKNIVININVDSNKSDEAEPQAIEVFSSNNEEVQPSSTSNITWVEMVKICLLFGIFVCVFRRPTIK